MSKRSASPSRMEISWKSIGAALVTRLKLQICESIAESDDWEVVQPNSNAMGPYAFKGNQWVGYDDEQVVKPLIEAAKETLLTGNT